MTVSINKFVKLLGDKCEVFTHEENGRSYWSINYEASHGMLIVIHSNLCVSTHLGLYDPDYGWIGVNDEWYYFHSILQLKKWLKKYYL